ncbi:MAG TPA: hypothetical protein VFZ66_28040 [Herpetosiphonaceae bacterium]
MTMHFTRITISRDLIRDEVINYVRENRASLSLPQPIEYTGAYIVGTHEWFNQTKQVGISINTIIDMIYNKLISSGKARTENVAVNNSSTMTTFNAYFPLQVKTIILEEILDLTRLGVLTLLQFTPKNQGINYDFVFDVRSDRIVLTEYGSRFITEASPLPFFSNQYLGILRQVSEPDDELQAYLSEGITCLRNQLARAAAILLRLAAEHSLDKLIDSTKLAIPTDQERSSFMEKIRKASTNLQQRAEVAFQKLESSSGLIPSQLDKSVRYQLRAAFHSIRELGGRAAHKSNNILLQEVTDHYTLYAGSVYSIVNQVIDYQTTQRLSPPPT